MRLTFDFRGDREAQQFWQRFDQQMATQVQALGEQASDILGQALRQAAPKRTGAGAKSIQRRPAKGERVGRSEWLWRFFGRSYLLYTVPPGTRPHEIRARKAKALRFYWEKGPRGPGIYFFARVHHPGYRPAFDWRRVALERARPQVATLLKGWQFNWPLYRVR
jgi:hypothetical protein